jgi:hypothetical protein
VSPWRFLMDSLWDGYLIRYLARCKQEQLGGDGGHEPGGVA